MGTLRIASEVSIFLRQVKSSFRARRGRQSQAFGSDIFLVVRALESLCCLPTFYSSWRRRHFTVLCGDPHILSYAPLGWRGLWLGIRIPKLASITDSLFFALSSSLHWGRERDRIQIDQNCCAVSNTFRFFFANTHTRVVTEFTLRERWQPHTSVGNILSWRGFRS